MQVTQTVNENLCRAFDVVVPQADIEKKLNDKLLNYGKKTKISGFRPGKVPLSVLKKRFGLSFMGEVLDETVREKSSQVLQEHDLRPAYDPKIEVKKFNQDASSDLEFEMTLEIFPHIDLMDFSSISLERLSCDVEDDQINESLDYLGKQWGEKKKANANRKARKGDFLVIDFQGQLDGKPFDGGQGENYSLELGSATFIPGFEEALEGKTLGQVDPFNVRFPENYQSEQLANQEVEFKVTIKEINTIKPMAQDDEMAKKMGLESLEQLKERIKGDFVQRYEGISRQKLKESLMDKLDQGHDFPLPETLIDNELQAIVAKAKQSQKDENQDAPQVNEDAPQVNEEEYRPMAQRRVRLGLVLAEIGQRENIHVSKEELESVIMQQAQQYPGQEKKIFEFYTKNPDSLKIFQAQIFEDKVLDYILSLVKFEDRKVSLKELNEHE